MIFKIKHEPNMKLRLNGDVLKVYMKKSVVYITLSHSHLFSRMKI